MAAMQSKVIYKVVIADDRSEQDIDEAVTASIAAGWMPCGGVSISMGSSGIVYAQAMMITEFSLAGAAITSSVGHDKINVVNDSVWVTTPSEPITAKPKQQKKTRK